MYVYLMEYSWGAQIELLCNENIPGMQVISSNGWYFIFKTRIDTIHSTVLPVLTPTRLS